MIKNILNLEGSQEITTTEQKMIVGSYAKETASRCDTCDDVKIADEDCTDYMQ